MTTPLEPFAARSDIGLVRTGNEDRYFALPPVFAVADGMGGHQAGEVASAIAVELLGYAANDPAALDGAAIVRALERSNSAIRAQARARPELDGMGTTCTVAVVSNGTVEIAHVGDSRAYLLRAGVLRQLTEDHSLVATLVREGIIGPDEASTDERRHIITRALGADDAVRVDRVTAALEPGDRLLLCSDGLSGQVPDSTIGAAMASEPDPARAADRLVELANAAGGDDNVTVVVIDPDRLPALPAIATADVVSSADVVGAADVVSSADADARSDAPRRRSGPRPTAVVLIGVLAVAVVIAALRAMGSGNGPAAASPTPVTSPAVPSAIPSAATATPGTGTPSPSSPAASVAPSPSVSATPSR